MIPVLLISIFIFAAGVIIGTRLDLIVKQLSVSRNKLEDKLRRKDPLEGKNGMLSYKNLRIRSLAAEDENEEEDEDV